MNALPMQKMREHKPGGTGSHNANLGLYFHYLFRRDFLSDARGVVSAENIRITSRGTGLLSIRSGSASDAAAQTLTSKHSTARTFLLNNRWRTEKLLRRHSVISDSTTTASENRDGVMNEARKSTRGIPTI